MVVAWIGEGISLGGIDIPALLVCQGLAARGFTVAALYRSFHGAPFTHDRVRICPMNYDESEWTPGEALRFQLLGNIRKRIGPEIVFTGGDWLPAELIGTLVAQSPRIKRWLHWCDLRSYESRTGARGAVVRLVDWSCQANAGIPYWVGSIPTTRARAGDHRMIGIGSVGGPAATVQTVLDALATVSQRERDFAISWAVGPVQDTMWRAAAQSLFRFQQTRPHAPLWQTVFECDALVRWLSNLDLYVSCAIGQDIAALQAVRLGVPVITPAESECLSMGSTYKDRWQLSTLLASFLDDPTAVTLTESSCRHVEDRHTGGSLLDQWQLLLTEE